MLVRCQICSSNVSDQAAACPKCGADKPTFLGPSSYCYECGAATNAAYESCADCGAPRSKPLEATTVLPSTGNVEVAPPVAVLRLPDPLPPPAYETAEAKQQGGAGRAIGAVISTLIAIAIGVFISNVVREAMRPEAVVDKPTTAADFEIMFAENGFGPFYELIKTELPEDYEIIMGKLMDFANTSPDFSSEEAAFEAGYEKGREILTEFMKSNWRHLEAAPDAELIAVGQVMSGLFSDLNATDLATCGSLARGEAMQQADASAIDRHREVMTEASTVFIKAIVAGKKRPTYRQTASETDWENLIAQVTPAMTPQYLDEVFNAVDPMSMSDAALCEMSTLMLKEMMRESPERQSVWIASMYEGGEAFLQ